MSDWSSDVVSSDLRQSLVRGAVYGAVRDRRAGRARPIRGSCRIGSPVRHSGGPAVNCAQRLGRAERQAARVRARSDLRQAKQGRSEEHTSELQSLMRISYAVFCLKKKKQKKQTQN